MRRITRLFVCVIAGVLLGPVPASAVPGGTTLVLPFRTVGTSDTTAVVTRDLLAGELETLGLSVVSMRSLRGDTPSGEGGCDEVGCALSLASEHQAAQVVFGSLSRLGDKFVVRVRAVRAGEAKPFYSDQIPAEMEEDLDVVMRRIAEGIAGGRTDSDRATISSVTDVEANAARRRKGRSGIGLRTGFLFPVGDSYGGTDRMTNLRLAYKFEGQDFFIESTALLGFAWGERAFEWTPFDVFAARIFGVGDVSGYFGGGLGMRVVSVESDPVYVLDEFGGYNDTKIQSAATLAAEVGGGLIAFRTYGYQVIVDLRYQHVLETFNKVGGKGAHGFVLSFGTSH
jgi:catechol 2,3-dioxygenase-like lactoylglutathione lyase family enzyme